MDMHCKQECIVFIFLYVVVAAKFYRKRQHEEPSQYNQQQVVEHVYELYLKQEIEKSTLFESNSIKPITQEDELLFFIAHNYIQTCHRVVLVLVVANS